MIRACALILGLGGCAGADASHVPPLPLLPFAAVSAGAANLAYDARRSRVKALIASEYDSLRADIARGHGPSLLGTMDMARIPGSRRTALLTELRTNTNVYFGQSREENLEALTVAFSVYGGE